MNVINQNLFGLGTSATVTINEYSKALEREGRTIYKFGFGQSPFPVPEPIVASLRKHAHEKDYLPVKGLPALRSAIAGFINRRKNTQVEADDVIIGPGSKELMFLLQLSYYGELVIPAPSWVSYAPQAQIIGRRITRVETRPENHLLLMPAELESICQTDPDRPRLVILNYPANPTGTAYDADTLQAMAEVARRYKVLILSDEIYAELYHKEHRDSVASYYPEGTIISGGLSKWCGAGGWRLGFFAFPKSMKRLQDAMAVCASETFTSTSAPIQYAAVEAFLDSPVIDHYLETARRILTGVGTYCHERLFAAGIEMPAPHGGFYLFPDFEHYRSRLQDRGMNTAAELCSRLLDEAGVALLPGSDFGTRPERLTARLSYVDFDGGAVMKSAESKEVDPAFVEQHCPRIKDGITSIIRFMEQ